MNLPTKMANAIHRARGIPIRRRHNENKIVGFFTPEVPAKVFALLLGDGLPLLHVKGPVVVRYGRALEWLLSLCPARLVECEEGEEEHGFHGFTELNPSILNLFPSSF